MVGTALVFRFGALPCTCNVQSRNVEIGESKGNQQEVGCGKRFQCVNQFNVGKMGKCGNWSMMMETPLSVVDNVK